MAQFLTDLLKKKFKIKYKMKKRIEKIFFEKKKNLKYTYRQAHHQKEKEATDVPQNILFCLQVILSAAARVFPISWVYKI